MKNDDDDDTDDDNNSDLDNDDDNNNNNNRNITPDNRKSRFYVGRPLTEKDIRLAIAFFLSFW